MIAVLMGRLLGRRCRFERPEDVPRLVVAVAGGTAISATVGTLALRVHGEIDTAGMATLWRTWFLADTSGGVLVAPLLLVWAYRQAPMPRRRGLEAVALGITVVALSYGVFATRHPLTYVIFPPLIWATLRFGQRGGLGAVAVVAAYLVSSLAELVSWLRPLKTLSPWYHALGVDPLGTGWSPGHLAALVGGSLVLVLLGAALFDRRDLVH